MSDILRWAADKEAEEIENREAAKTEEERSRIIALVKESTKIMLRKNRERGNVAQEVGLLGLFLEVRTMFLRLRNLVWDKDLSHLENPLFMPADARVKWTKDVRNALQDLRNYAVLAEMALLDKNYKGGNDEYLSDRQGSKDTKVR